MHWTSIVYFIPMFILFFGMSNRKNIRHVAIFFGSISLVVIAGLRFEVGFDYSEYLWRLSENIPPREPLSVLIFQLIRAAGVFELYFLIYSLFTIGILFDIARRSGNAWIIINYVALPWFFHESFSAIRQGLSISFSVAAYYYYIRRENSPFLAYGLLSILSHFAAIPFVMTLLFLNASSGRIIRVVLVFLLCIVAYYFDYIYELLADQIGILRFYSSGTQFGAGQLVLLLLLVFVAGGSVRLRDHELILWVGVLVFYICLSLDFALSRLAWYFFVPLLWIQWDIIFRRVRLKGFWKLLPYCGLCVLIGVNLLVKSTDDRNSLVPYQTIIGTLW